MKHDHRVDTDVNVNVTLPTEELKELIDHASDATMTIIAAVTVAAIVKRLFTR